MASNRGKKNRARTWVATLAVIAVAGAGGYFLSGMVGSGASATTAAAPAVTGEAQTATGNYAQVTRGSITATVYGEGSLAPASKHEIYTEVEGKAISVEVETGDTVDESDVLMRLSSDDLESEISELQAELFARQIELADVRDKGSDTYIYAPCAGRIKLINVEKDDDIAVAMKTEGQLAVISRDDKLKVEFEPSADMPALKVGDQVTAWIDSEAVAAVVDQLSGLGGRISVTVEDDEYELGEEVLVSTLQGDKLGTGVLEINMPVPVTGIGGNVSKVYYDENDTVSSGSTLFYLDGRIPSSDLQQALLNYNNAKTDLDNALEKQENLVVRAPISGVITSVNVSESQQLEVSTNALSIQSSNEFKLNADVDELDIVNVEAGQRATVTLDAYPGKVFEGTVTKVSGIAKVSGGVATYEVTVAMDQSLELKDGMTASMNIVSGEKSGILMVPADAIGSVSGQSCVTTSDGRTVYVETGIANQDYVEIVSGLSEGELVQVRERASQTSSADGFPMGGRSMLE